MPWMVMRFHKGTWQCVGQFYSREQAVEYLLSDQCATFPGEYEVMCRFDGRAV